jgi:hypothetical protein
MLKRLLASGITAVAIIGLAAPAQAAPSGGEMLTLECDLLGTVDITTGPGHGLWTPGFVAGTTQRLVPYAFRFEFGSEVEEFSKRAPRSGMLDRCEFSDGDLSGTVWLSYTPE